MRKLNYARFILLLVLTLGYMLVVVTMFTTQMIIYVIVMKSCVEKHGRKIIQKII